MAENKKTPAKEKKGGPAFSLSEAAGWLGVLVFVCAWFFVLGILVGRGFVPAPPTEADSLNEFLQHKRAESIENQAQDTPSNDLKLGFHEALKTDAPADRHDIPSASSPVNETPAVKTPKTTKPDNIPTPAGSPDAPTAKNDGEKIFTIQVAAVRDESDAVALISKLKKKGFSAYSTTVELSGGNRWYRIRCGAYESRQAAAPTLDKLEDEGFGPMLVRK
ncbi:MAG: SPOR domain-containing protein [Thermodesulfobacteriota bacterium]|nr:SPOR domain-containing protein [Thermodesulfobacteriota bacterium]